MQLNAKAAGSACEVQLDAKRGMVGANAVMNGCEVQLNAKIGGDRKRGERRERPGTRRKRGVAAGEAGGLRAQ